MCRVSPVAFIWFNPVWLYCDFWLDLPIFIICFTTFADPEFILYFLPAYLTWFLVLDLKYFISAPENHTDSTLVQIYIVTDENRVEFTFQNTLNTVVALQSSVRNRKTRRNRCHCIVWLLLQIQNIFEELFQYSCNIESILSDTDETGAAMDTQTVVTVHFIDSEMNEPVNRTTIQMWVKQLILGTIFASCLVRVYKSLQVFTF